jgi:AraC family transcriptional regulator, regulatory protein of adaptative response / methylated-DNA-[protein]-cysteine methyltransferase
MVFSNEREYPGEPKEFQMQGEFDLTEMPSRTEMEKAFFERDSGYDGVFFVGVTTTGIFCKPSCPANKPLEKNIEYYGSAREALFAGFRPCKRCKPLSAGIEVPEWAGRIFDRVDAEPESRIRDRDLREMDIDPVMARRWFKRNYGMTFQAYVRARRLGHAFEAIKQGSPLDDAILGHGWESFSGFREAFARQFGSTPGKAADADFIRLGWIETPIGPMIAGAMEAGLCLLEFTDRRMLEAQFETLRSRFGMALIPTECPLFDRLRKELAEYFAGERKTFTVPLVMKGSEFQEKTWRGLLELPYGRTKSYAELARDIGADNASRAVGHANGLNRIAILVPCHRVITADGELGGYGGGLWRKKALLELERGERRFAG